MLRMPRTRLEPNMPELVQIPFADYKAIDAVNWSSLRWMRQSPAHYRYHLDHPQEDTTSAAFGRAVHCAVFEPDRLPLDFPVFKGARRAGKEWQAFRAVHGADATILKVNEYERCLGVRDAVRAHPTAAKFLRAGHAEATATWTDEATGLRCKGRLDFVSTSIPALVDLKSTHDLAGLGPAAARYGWNCQLALYSMGLRALGFDLPVRVVAVETKAPFAVRVLTLHADDLWRGEREVAELLAKVADCRERGSWPAGGEEEQVLSIPSFGLRLAEQDDLTAMGIAPRKAI
jgi:hypothetical protein